MPGPALYGKRAAKARPRAGHARPLQRYDRTSNYVRSKEILR